jgi:hypothetical protein
MNLDTFQVPGFCTPSVRKNVTMAGRSTFKESLARSAWGDFFWVIILHPRAAQLFTSEIRVGALRPSLVTVRRGLQLEQSPVSAILYTLIGSKFSNPGSQQSINTRTFPLRTTLRIRNCLIISRSSARSWRLSSNTPMPRKSNERPGRMRGRTAGSAGGKVTSWKN